MMNRFLIVLALGAILLAGCKGKGPVPDAENGPKVGTSETTGAHPGAANPHSGATTHGGDPHAGLDIDPAGGSALKAPQIGDDGMLDAGDIAFSINGPWKVQPLKSSMRRAQLLAEGEAGPAEFIVYYFGPQGAGSAQDNIDRWVGQFSGADGTAVDNPEVERSDKTGFQTTRVEVAGSFSNSMAPGAAPTMSNQRMIAAIVETKGGPYYFKFIGPDATVTAHRKAFDELLASIVAAP
jgi:hypothetical protein